MELTTAEKMMLAAKQQMLLRQAKQEKIKGELTLNQYEVYMEGYIANGNSAPATYVGIGTGTNFAEAAKDACIKAYGEAETKRCFNVRNGVPSYWGCRLYDNISDAQRAFG